MSPIISVRNLDKSFKIYKKEEGLLSSFQSLFHREYLEVKAVNNVSFDINQGEFIGFIGPNGSGKTTTLKCLSGLLYPTSGEVTVMGYTPWERKRDFLKNISLVMGQKNQLWWDLPPVDSFSLNKEIYQIEDRVYKERFDELVDLLEVKNILNVQVRRLSLGQRMRCELMNSLLHNPKVIFLDEPTIGLDVIMQKKLHHFLAEYNRKYQTTVILTSHYMDDVKELCSRVIVINTGTLIYDGELDSLVRTYIPYKYLTLVSSKKLDESMLSKYAQVVECIGNRAVLSIPRDDVASVSSKILAKIDVVDLEISEMRLEDVIRKVFDNN